MNICNYKEFLMFLFRDCRIICFLTVKITIVGNRLQAIQQVIFEQYFLLKINK